MHCHQRKAAYNGLLASAAVLLGLTCIPAAPAASPSPSRLPDIVGPVLATVVAITATTIATAAEPGRMPTVSHDRGSGFVIDPAGFIVTNKHVVSGATDIEVRLHDGTILTAELAGESTKADIALLRVHPATPLSTTRFRESDDVRVGEDVFAIGNPLGFTSSVSAGIVSALNRDIMESPFDDYIQTDAAINHGNSGGPLFDMNGDVIGMTSVIFAPGDYGGSIGLGFAIPSDEIRFVCDQIRLWGRVRAAYIDAQFQDLSARLAQGLGLPPGAGGAVMVEVTPDGPAAQAGLRTGDVVSTFGHRRITDARALARAIATAPFDTKTPVEIWRGGALLRLDVTATEAADTKPSGAAGPAFPMAAADRMVHRLGLTLAATSSQQADDAGSSGGVEVTDVEPNSAASSAGLKAGEIVIMTDATSITGPQSFMRALQASRMSGHTFTPLLVRGIDGALRWTALSNRSDG